MERTFKKKSFTEYDVVVIGAGHSGCEAALASAKNKSKTLIINISLDNVATMQHGNVLGGNVKGHLLREIDILGGEIGANTWRNAINVVKSENGNNEEINNYRFTVDKRRYSLFMKNVLESQENLDMRQGLVVEIKKIKDGFKIKTSDCMSYGCNAVVISPGSFLNGNIFWGKYRIEAGKQGEINSKRLQNSLEDLGFKFKKAFTFTTPGIDGKTINFNMMKRQKSVFRAIMSSNNVKFEGRLIKKSFITYIKNNDFGNILNSPRAGNEEIEKIFSDYLIKIHKRNNGLIILQPEGINTTGMYPENIPMAFSEKEQLKIIQNVRGLENASITRPGYGIEYSILEPLQTGINMKSPVYDGIFFAGIINGTYGYEESAAQGIIAGINASLYSKGLGLIDMKKEVGYTGILFSEISLGDKTTPIDIVDLKSMYNFKYDFFEVYKELYKILRFIGRKKEIENMERVYGKYPGL
ncbi:MAG: FAD-dependent oxidoreductase [Actinobacteria bacterium]|nr:FAD-dependent oxidoreductase [Actinomycetota bacterium]